jgi:hypothetical protein
MSIWKGANPLVRGPFDLRLLKYSIETQIWGEAALEQGRAGGEARPFFSASVCRSPKWHGSPGHRPS